MCSLEEKRTLPCNYKFKTRFLGMLYKMDTECVISLIITILHNNVWWW